MPDRPTLLAVPGLGLTPRTTAPTLSALGPGWRTGVVRLPGYGEPCRSGVLLDPAVLAGRLLDRLDRPAVLLGHSASCHVVAEAARRAPGRVAGLVLVGPTGDPRLVPPVLVHRWLRTAVHEHLWELPVLVPDWLRNGPVTMARGFAATRRQRLSDVLAGVEAPVLVVRGRHDRIAPADWVAALAAAAPRGTAASLAGGAHMVPLTRPASLAARIEAVLGGARTRR
ncbi:alpha/beta fold hydrolase [Pseudonocardia broussonetiae]|uniref:Alpha/beta fold hydrolase n=1 Tax=Pseudonocardia broussonetiae TaxID=2736640 RepID=A0A6M6JCC5_9PSEU|nr:alpha/beta fold hydrolase [Pseudonocardia broussonetiae]QJY44575.1 alpha/beta fold hydrolase [Pseudonocardia broussonetiae]